MIKEPVKPTDPATLEICDDPIPNHRASCGNKYESVFSKLKVGQAIKCQPLEVARMSNSLRKWASDNKIKGNVRSMKDYGDGRGRVWLVEKPEKAKTLKAVA